MNKRAEYLPGSYKATGQDGLHYNAALIDPPANTAAPVPVIQALYEVSDHLPVQADFVLHTDPLPASVASPAASALNEVTVVNPVGEKLELQFSEHLIGQALTIYVHSLVGQELVYQKVAV